jgi:alkylation response protein AidB-like acyl-CoA dehydrogenase
MLTTGLTLDKVAVSQEASQQNGSGARASQMLSFLRGYADERLNSRLIDERRCIPPSVILDVANAGLLGLQIEREYGGQQLSLRDTFGVLEQIAAIDPNLMLLVSVHNLIGIPPLRHFGTPQQKAEVLPMMASGRGLATIAASEPGAGSNVRAITTKATRQSGGYVLNGAKSWISLGSWARYVNMFAQLHDEHNRPMGITGFLVDTTTKGYVPGEEVLTLGMKGIPQNHVTLRDMRMGPDGLLGGEGDGLAVAQTAFMMGRAGIGAVSLGAMKRCLQIAHRYAGRRTVATGTLLDNGRTAQILTECLMATRAVEALVGHVVDEVDAGRDVPAEVYFACKVLSSELMWQVVDRCVQMMGARGFMDTNVVGQYFRDYRLLRIFEGATEAVTGYIGQMVLRDPAAFIAMVGEEFDVPATGEVLTALDSLPVAAATYRATFRRNGRAGEPKRRRHILTDGAASLAFWGILAAVTAKAGNGTGIDDGVAQWCLRNLKARACAFNEQSFDVEPLSTDLIDEQIAGYARAIGDTEQSLPGEASPLDLLLTRNR